MSFSHKAGYDSQWLSLNQMFKPGAKVGSTFCQYQKVRDREERFSKRKRYETDKN